MKQSGSMTTCVPIQTDYGGWETAVFFQLAGPECEGDRRIVRNTKTSISIGVEVDLIEHSNAGIAVLRFEVHTVPDNPMVGEVLLAPGQGGTQFESLENLRTQNSIKWYFGDEAYRVIHSQQTPLHPHQREGFSDLLKDCVRHDAMIRATGQYNAIAALTEVSSHYQPRETV